MSVRGFPDAGGSSGKSLPSGIIHAHDALIAVRKRFVNMYEAGIRERFSLKKVKREAAQRRPASRERKNRVFPRNNRGTVSVSNGKCP